MEIISIEKKTFEELVSRLGSSLSEWIALTASVAAGV